MSELLDKINGRRVLALYRCGSYLFGTDGPDSDKDYTAILEDYDSCNIYKVEGADYFIYGMDVFKEALTFKSSHPGFLVMWLDNVLLAEENLIYIDEKFKEEFKKIIDVDWNSVFPVWLKKNLDYFKTWLEIGQHAKLLYHIYRLRSLVSHYRETGKFEAFLSEEDKENIIDYKIRNANTEKHLSNFKEIIIYLETILKEEEQ